MSARHPIRRLCLIGNSHLVALQDALQARPGGWPLECTFVPFRGNGMEGTAVEDGQLRPVSDKAMRQMKKYMGAEAVDLAGFDAFAVVGYSLNTRHALAWWREARWPGLPSLEAVEDLAGLEPALVSRPAAEAALGAYMAEMTGFIVAGRLRAATGKPVFIIGQPRLHEDARTDPVFSGSGLRRVIGTGDGPVLSALHEAAAGRAAQSRDIRAVPQPHQTLKAGFLTDRRYMAGEIQVTREGKRVNKHDLKHPNAAHGALTLDAVTAMLAEARAA